MLPPAAIASSAKFEALATLLPRLHREGHRVVIFSQWTMTLDLLEEFVGGPGGLGLRHLRFDGSTPADDRQIVIDEFNGNGDVFALLLTTRAGGVGINLTSADTCILHDVDFNPMVDRQVRVLPGPSRREGGAFWMERCPGARRARAGP